MTITKEKNFISAVLYVHNYEALILDFLKSLNKLLSENFEKYEIICVNDASTDESIDLIRNFSKTTNRAMVSIINMSYFHGIELSMNAGVDLAIGDFVFEFDSLSMDYDTNFIMKIYTHCLKGFDIVSASPNIKQRFSSKLFYNLFNKNSNVQHGLSTESFRLLSRRAINRVRSMNKTIPYRKAVYHNCGLKLDVVKYDCINGNTNKKEKLLEYSRRETAIDSMILFTNLASKLSIFMTFFMMLITILVASYTTIVFVKNKPVAGWTTTMLFLSVVFFSVFIIFSIIIKYLSILVEFIFKKQIYVIEGIEKLTN